MATGILDNTQKSNQQERCQFKWNGFHRALVIDAEDPRLLGRCKLRIPDLMPEDGGDFCKDWCKFGLWAHPANNHMGGRNVQDTMGQRCDYEDAWYQGSCLIPPKGSWVFVFFENGDPNHPYYFGSLEAGQRKVLPECQQGPEYWKKWVLHKTRSGRCIVMSDDDGHDSRVEITGKKRLIANPPDGDDASVYLIDENMTTIFLDERPGEEKLLIKDYRGNYIVYHTKDSVAEDQLHIFFHDDIHIETEKNLFVKTGEDCHFDIGNDYRLTAGGKIDTKASLGHKEKALSFDRLALLKDNRTAMTSIQDMAGVKLTHLGGVKLDCMGGCSNTMSSGSNTNISSDGPINISGALTNIQCGAPFTMPIKFASMAKSAISAIPDGLRREEPDPQFTFEPPVPIEDLVPPIDKIADHVITQGYKSAVGASIIEPSELINLGDEKLNAAVIQDIKQDSGSSDSGSSEPISRLFGAGHVYTLCLKKKYWEKIPPLVDKSYGSYVGFYAFKNYNPSIIDYDFIDTNTVPVYDDYENPSSWAINTDDLWWQNLYDFCRLSSMYQLTVVPSILDFYDSPTDPYLTKLSNPYEFNNWDNNIQGKYLRNLVDILKQSGANFILNLGVREYNQSMPDPGYLRNMILFLVEELGISSNNLALSNSLYSKNPYCRYRTIYDDNPPSIDQINIEEKVDGNYGGTGRVEVYNSDGTLIDGYLKYIMDSNQYGVALMNTWKMNQFEIPDGMTIDDENIMNYVFAPNQREAMRKVLGNENNNGFIDFS